MAITAKQVKELRDRTGVGMMDAKKALVEVDGDMDKAIDFLREKGIAKAAKTPSSSNDKQVNSVDCARELNRYYVGTVASSEVPSSKSFKDTQTSQSSVKTLPSTGDDTQQHSIQLLASLLLVMGTSLLLKRKHHSHSYLSTEHF